MKKTLTSSILNYDTISQEEIPILICKISLAPKPPLIIGVVYRKPDNDLISSTQISDVIKKLSDDYKRSVIWIGGDFNLPDINWKNNSIEKTHYPRDLNNIFVDTFSDCGLQQVVQENTRQNSTLDLFLSNHPSHVEAVSILPGLGDHDVVQIDTRIKPKRKRPIKRKIFLWKKADVTNMKKDSQKFASEFLERFTNDDDICEQWELFSTNMKTILANNVPQRTTTSKIHRPWITTKTKRLLRKKRKVFSRMKRTNSDFDKEQFKNIKSETQRECRKAHADYVNSIVNDPADNNKKLWSYVKDKNRDYTGIAPLKDQHGTFQSDPKIKADLLNRQFCCVFSNPSNDENQVSVDDIDVDTPQLGDIHISESGVAKLLRNIKDNKATGPDDIPAKLLKSVSNEISGVLTLMFQTSLKQGRVPPAWKQARVSPLFKKGDRSRAENYRPVSITSITCKLLEHIIYSNIMTHLENHNLLTDMQHGFRKKRSCETQLIVTCNDIAENMNRQMQTDAILLDFSKAFDKVHHLTLATKLRGLGIVGKNHEWIMDFLNNRQQQVVVEGATSDPAPVLSGVPQGTVLGPLLFLIYINDMPGRISPGTKLRLFADDSLLYRTIDNISDAETLQHDLDNLQAWEKENSMEFHPQKCQVLRITNKKKIIQAKYNIHEITLEEVSKAKYLGVTINNKLTWRDHISTISRKANSTLGFLQRNLFDSKKNIKEKCYKSYVRPTLEYGSAVWDPHFKKDINELEHIQKRAQKFIDRNSYKKDESGQKFETLEERRKKNKLLLFHKGQREQARLPLEGLIKNPRKPSKFTLPQSRIDSHLYSFVPSTLRLWNNLRSPVKSVSSVDVFKSLL